MDRLEKAEEALKAARDDHEFAYESEIKKLDDMKRELLDRLHDLDEKKKQCAAVYGNDKASDDDLIEINAGGKIIAAKRGVLCQLKGTRFEALFCGKWDEQLLRDAQGRIFLDVNPKAFRAIVYYLNEMAISAEDDQPNPPCEDVEVTQVLKYFGLRFFGSNIIRQFSHFNVIRQWLEEDGSEGDLNLIYRSSRDGLSNEMFHNKCDDVGPTLVVFELEDGCVVGGYSNTSWRSTGDYMYADKAFMFALQGFGISSPIKMKLKHANDCAIRGSGYYGPIFGNGEVDDIVMDGSDVIFYTSNYTQYEDVPWHQEVSTSHGIEEMEVYQVKGKQRSLNPTKNPPTVDRFTKAINDAINEKWISLVALEKEVTSLEDNYKDEEQFVESLSSGDEKDIITLNVSGTMMATKRSTLMFAEDSVLAQQFDDTKWTEQGNGNIPNVKEWIPDDVTNWVKSIEGIPNDIASLFWENEINGLELLALNENGLKMLGVERVGTICLLFDEIKSLKEKVNKDGVTLIEHSPYCFGKMLDYLRLKRLDAIDLAEEPGLPTVCELQQKRFEKVVKYYFPGDSSSFILGP